MFSLIKHWYKGESKMQEFKNNFHSTIFYMPIIYIEYHWSAKIARATVGFYLRHWQWLWSTIIAVLGLYVAVLALN